MVDLNDFKIQSECSYKDECYTVRDNGAILRYPINTTRPRPTDNKWTFGKLNNKTGYLEIASVSIHRIVATAFFGEPPTKDHVVDHIDTNKQNNRPENLRWVTRLENILLNPITARRIELICGSVEAFLADPSKFRDKFQDPNYDWMCTVSIQEAQNSKTRLLSWAESEKPLIGGTLGEWIYNRSLPNIQIEQVLEFTNSLTQNAKQMNWKSPTEFPCCPQRIGSNPILMYADKIKAGKVFSQNQYSKSIIDDFAISADKATLWIVCKSNIENAIKQYTLAEVTYQDGFFVHNSLGSFFKEDGAKKQFNLVQGLEWTGTETFDELC
jgi:HNH endonuclease